MEQQILGSSALEKELLDRRATEIAGLSGSIFDQKMENYCVKLNSLLSTNRSRSNTHGTNAKKDSVDYYMQRHLELQDAYDLFQNRQLDDVKNMNDKMRSSKMSERFQSKIKNKLQIDFKGKLEREFMSASRQGGSTKYGGSKWLTDHQPRKSMVQLELDAAHRRIDPPIMQEIKRT